MNGKMEQAHTHNPVFIILAVLLLSACAVSGVNKADDPEVDLFELERTADASYQEGDMAASEQHYLVLVRKLPEEALHWFRLGNIYARTQRPDAAVTAYREAVLRNPQYSKAWYNMGIVQLRQAANSFNEMQVHTPSDDPLHEQGKEVLEGILEIIKQE